MTTDRHRWDGHRYNETALVSAVVTGLSMSAAYFLSTFFFIGNSLRVLNRLLKKDDEVGSSNYGVT